MTRTFQTKRAAVAAIVAVLLGGLAAIVGTTAAHAAYPCGDNSPPQDVWFGGAGFFVGLDSGDSTTAVEVGVRFGYALRQRHRFFVDVSASRAGGAIKDSPLVERATEPGVRIGYLYAF